MRYKRINYRINKCSNHSINIMGKNVDRARSRENSLDSVVRSNILVEDFFHPIFDYSRRTKNFFPFSQWS